MDDPSGLDCADHAAFAGRNPSGARGEAALTAMNRTAHSAQQSPHVAPRGAHERPACGCGPSATASFPRSFSASQRSRTTSKKLALSARCLVVDSSEASKRFLRHNNRLREDLLSGGAHRAACVMSGRKLTPVGAFFLLLKTNWGIGKSITALAGGDTCTLINPNHPKLGTNRCNGHAIFVTVRGDSYGRCDVCCEHADDIGRYISTGRCAEGEFSSAGRRGRGSAARNLHPYRRSSPRGQRCGLGNSRRRWKQCRRGTRKFTNLYWYA